MIVEKREEHYRGWKEMFNASTKSKKAENQKIRKSENQRITTTGKRE
tara:strand:- start:320 stop:460 length:141 start_codon:yes stop_codon:yes gene_type:complete